MKLAASHRQASAVIVVLALLGILSLYVLVNARTLARLKHDVKQIEQRQIQRLQSAKPLSATLSNPETNRVANRGNILAVRNEAAAGGLNSR